MKTKTILLIVVFILLDLAIIYSAFLLGKHISPITNNEANCLLNKNPENNIIVSKEQAICLVNEKEVITFYGVGNPVYAPDNFVRLELKSGKLVLLEGDTVLLSKELENLGVRGVSK